MSDAPPGEYPADTSYDAYLRWAEQYVMPAGGIPFSREEYLMVLADIQRAHDAGASA